VDDDILPPMNGLEKFLQADKDIIGACAFAMKYENGVGFPYPVTLRYNEEKKYIVYYGQGIEECDATGGAFVMFKRKVYEAIERPYEFQYYRNGTLALTCDFDVCLLPNQYVVGEKITKIENINKGEIVMSHEGTLKEVKNLFQREYNGDIIEILPKYNLPIKLTANHQLLCTRFKKTNNLNKIKGFGGIEYTFNTLRRCKEWVKAEEIEVGDYVLVPKINKSIGVNKEVLIVRNYLSNVNYKLDGNYGLISFKSGSKTSLPRELKLEKDFLRVIGLYIAEGYNSNQRVDFSLHVNEIEYQNDIINYFNKMNIRIMKRQIGNCIHLAFSSSIWVNLFSNLGGIGSRNKHLPDFWNKLSDENLIILLKGYFDGDGCIQELKDGIRISVSTVSEILARQVRSALLRLNIFSSITYDLKKHKYTLIIISKFRRRFIDLFNYSCNMKLFGKKSNNRTGYIENEDGIWVKVKKVDRQTYNGLVYNLETDKPNTYNVEGIAIHNCQKAQKLGFKLFIDFTLICDHIRTVSIKGVNDLMVKEKSSG
jgi:intein/homing endonuclease